jgi:site-specific recombinase XerD
MKTRFALARPKSTSVEKKIIAMVIDGLPSENSRRAYQRALTEFFIWHAEQNRPELNKALIQRYVKHLREQKSKTFRHQKTGFRSRRQRAD